MLLLSSGFFQDAVGCTNDTCHEDNALVQLPKSQSSTTTTTLPGRWVLGVSSQSCDDACEAVSGTCDLNTMKSETQSDLQSAFETLNTGYTFSVTLTFQVTSTLVVTDRSKNLGILYRRFFSGSGGAPSAQLALISNRSAMNCEENGGANAIGPLNLQRMCYCIPAQNNDPGIVNGDPHIQTLHGARYTLLREGTFRAWSFKKGQADLELLAAYGGPRFTTQALLLKEMSGKTMEMTAKDCAWHTLRGNDTSPIQFKAKGARKHKKFKDVFMQTIIMKQEHRKIAKLVSNCRIGKHMDFKVNMFRKTELAHVGGQLGAAPGSIKTGNHLLLLDQDMSMKADSEFKVEETWQSLGGSEEASVDLESKMQGKPTELSLLQGPCSEEATTMCAKHFPNVHSEVFLNCVFDTCHGGDEADAATAAELMSA